MLGWIAGCSRNAAEKCAKARKTGDALNREKDQRREEEPEKTHGDTAGDLPPTETRLAPTGEDDPGHV